MPSGSVATVAILRAAPLSSQAPQILHERVDLVFGEDGSPRLATGTDRHVVPWLDGLGVPQPVGQVRGGDVEDGPGEGRAVGEMREVGADDPRVRNATLALDPVDRVAPAASNSIHDGQDVRGRLGCGLGLLLNPRLEL